MSGAHVALLRGINVGGKNKLPMADLRDLFREAGCADVRTYIQSGNVLFRADAQAAAAVPDAVTAGIASRFGYHVPVLLRTEGEIAAVLDHNPFLAAGNAQETLHVLFLAGAPGAEQVAALDPDRAAPDAFAVHGQEIYLHLPNGAGRTKLTTDYFDTKLKTISTGRNWRTVTALLALLRE